MPMIRLSPSAMSTPATIIQASWVILIGYWVIAAFTAKRASRSMPRAGLWRFRLVVLIILIVLVRLSAIARLHGYRFDYAYVPSALVAYIGAIMCAAGVAFAIWARVYIGQNWGMPMSLREGHELVTRGPYAYVRHPIYSGILLALIGSGLALSPVQGVGSFVAFLVCLGGFSFAARIEERDMTKQFPDVYPAYKQRTKMLIPFIL